MRYAIPFRGKRGGSKGIVEPMRSSPCIVRENLFPNRKKTICIFAYCNLCPFINKNEKELFVTSNWNKLQ